jgi:membrane-bound serine protease (ClpP class)
MIRVLALALVALGSAGLVAGWGLDVAEASGPPAAVVSIDSIIDPVSAGYLSRAIDTAVEDGAQFIVIVVDTPGGLLDSTREMVEKILAAEVPVIAFVSPAGAHASSAGTFIVAAAHLAAMAPATNIGAAAPVGAGGEDLPDTIKSKATQDAAAFLRGIADARSRNADALEATVVSAAAYSAGEALEEGIVDLVADDLDDLFSKIDGRTVAVGDGDVVLDTRDLDVREIDRTPVERFLGLIANPNIAFLLLSLGGLGIMVELWSPGLIGPGVIGVILLALAFVVMGVLPVNWIGAGLIGLALVLFFLESQAAGIGIFGIGGAVSFVLGAFLLFGGFGGPAIPTPNYRVSIWLLSTVSVLLFAFLAMFFRTVIVARRAVYVSPSRDLVGLIGTATTALEPRGSVRVAGETWSAVSDSGRPIPEGDEVVVMDTEGLTLKVFNASEANE